MDIYTIKSWFNSGDYVDVKIKSGVLTCWFNCEMDMVNGGKDFLYFTGEDFRRYFTLDFNKDTKITRVGKDGCVVESCGVEYEIDFIRR